MDYLALINRTRVECGASGAGTALTSVTGLSAESSRFAGWVNEGWEDVQSLREDFDFLRTSVEFNLIAQQQTYTATDAGIGSTFGNWKRDSFRISSVGANYADEQLIGFMDFNTFRNMYQYGNMRTTYQRPVIMSVAPNKSLSFGCAPDQAYVCSGEYYRRPTTFTLATDVPDIPDRYHMLIVYKAMMSYGRYNAAPEVYTGAEADYKKLLGLFMLDQTPQLVSGPPLA
jgi:hypothetical protein